MNRFSRFKKYLKDTLTDPEFQSCMIGLIAGTAATTYIYRKEINGMATTGVTVWTNDETNEPESATVHLKNGKTRRYGPGPKES
jgi:hypothetical protein